MAGDIFKWRQTFDQYDEDQSGELSGDELKKMTEELWDMGSHSLELMQFMIEEADLDGDGQISWPEFCQMMQRMTNDVYLATPHRVIMPPSGVVPQRMSVVMFYRPGLQTVIEPPASLAATNKNALGTVYEPVTVSEFLQMPRSDEEGNPLKLTSNVLKDGRWVGARPGASVVPNAQ